MNVRSLIVPAVIAYCSLASLTQSIAEDEQRVRSAIAKALPYIEEQGVWWNENKKCVSCHRTTFMTWAMAEAFDHKFDIDSNQLSEYRNWSRESLLKPHKKTGKPTGLQNIDGLSQVLWSEQSRKLSGDEQAARTIYLELITSKQRADGTWKAGGQLPFQKRPKAETDFVSTAWNALALGTFTEKAAEEVRAKAIKALEMQPEAISTEWYVTRLLLAVQQESTVEQNSWTEKLLSLQKPDGGWGWIAAESSDALATGMALYALRHAGLPNDQATIQQAVAFLVSTQSDEGSWKVNSTKEKRKTKPAETSNYWGTCWATIGLLATLEESAASN